jgi:hypothetical protein
MVTPAMSYFLHLGLCRFGYVKESFSMLQKRFNHMLHDGSNGTLWEEWWLDGTGRSGTLVKARTRSDAQTESAFPPALFAEFILGVKPNGPGFQEVSLFHSPSGLKEVEGEIPSPLGNLTVRWRMAEPDGGSLYLEIPMGMRVNLDLESLASDRGVSLNGRSLGDTSLVSRYLHLSEGKHEIEF